jgi:thiol-disulfide isomerase/thioredoxin
MSRIPKRELMLTLLLAVSLVAAADAESELAVPRDSAMLYLRDGDFIAGALEDCDSSEVVRWQMRGATRPFDMEAAAVRAVHFPVPAETPGIVGDFVVELTDGDLLFGSLKEITEKAFVFDTAEFGELRIDRSEIRCFSTVNTQGAFVYRGPNGLADWKPSKAEDWSEEAGRLTTKVPRAKVEKELELPKLARIDVELAWTGKPEFVLAIGADKSEEALKEGYRFEVWQDSLVAIRALGEFADVAVVCELNKNETRMQFEALIDQERGSMIVCGADGKRLAAIDVPPEQAKHGNSLKCIAITNGIAEFRLEQLSVGRWSGRLPPKVDANKPGLFLADGEVKYGDVVGYDKAAKKFKLRPLAVSDTDEKSSDGNQNDAAPIEIAADQVASVFPAPNAEVKGATCRIALLDGSRISGDLKKIESGKVYLQRRGIDAPVACKVNQLRSLVVSQPATSPREVHGRLGRLELEGVRLHGALVESTEESETSLVWLPRWSKNESPLESQASGHIVYRDPPPQPKVEPAQAGRQAGWQRVQRVQRQPPRPAGFWGQVANIFANGNQAASASPPKSLGKGMLYLLSGDCIPYDSATIEEGGVRFTSSFVDANFVPNEQMKAIELVPKWTAVALAEEKRQRLLTLPRMQKPNPPTHLIASTGGDFLRVRVISMSVDKLNFESRLETKQVPRDRVACIIWLHTPEAMKVAAQAAESLKTDDTSMRVQAVRSSGPRLSFSPREFKGQSLSGESALHGTCHVDVQEIDALNIGSAIDEAAVDQPFQEWMLANAVEPSYLKEDGSAAEAGGTAATGLIGKEAPSVQLKLLDGRDFELADHKGNVVVLDFWASWCGPCMQAMPEVDAVVEEFAEQGVKLVAVNMQEDANAIQGALERLKLQPTVALDVDGALAEHYQVTAIPQTVVIDAEGVVAGVLVGAGPNMPNELRTLLKSQFVEGN